MNSRESSLSSFRKPGGEKMKRSKTGPEGASERRFPHSLHSATRKRCGNRSFQVETAFPVNAYAGAIEPRFPQARFSTR